MTSRLFLLLQFPLSTAFVALMLCWVIYTRHNYYQSVLEGGAREPHICIMGYTMPIYTAVGPRSPEGYRLFHFYEGMLRDRRAWFLNKFQKGMMHHGVPMVFLHGNSGSYQEGRGLGHAISVAALGRSPSADETQIFEWFTVDFLEEASIHSGDILLRHAHFVNRSVTFLLEKHAIARGKDSNAARSLWIVAHSMGGIVAKLIPLMGNQRMLREGRSHVAGIVTLSTPHLMPPVYADPSMYDLFAMLRYAWKRVDPVTLGKCLNREQENTNSLIQASDDSVFKWKMRSAKSFCGNISTIPTLSIGAGTLDEMVYEELTRTEHELPFSRDVSILDVEEIGIPVTHHSITWCRQFINVVGPAVVDLALGTKGIHDVLLPLSRPAIHTEPLSVDKIPERVHCTQVVDTNPLRVIVVSNMAVSVLIEGSLRGTLVVRALGSIDEWLAIPPDEVVRVPHSHGTDNKFAEIPDLLSSTDESPPRTTIKSVIIYPVPSAAKNASNWEAKFCYINNDDLPLYPIVSLVDESKLPRVESLGTEDHSIYRLEVLSNTVGSPGTAEARFFPVVLARCWAIDQDHQVSAITVSRVLFGPNDARRDYKFSWKPAVLPSRGLHLSRQCSLQLVTHSADVDQYVMTIEEFGFSIHWMHELVETMRLGSYPQIVSVLFCLMCFACEWKLIRSCPRDPMCLYNIDPRYSASLRFFAITVFASLWLAFIWAGGPLRCWIPAVLVSGEHHFWAELVSLVTVFALHLVIVALVHAFVALCSIPWQLCNWIKRRISAIVEEEHHNNRMQTFLVAATCIYAAFFCSRVAMATLLDGTVSYDIAENCLHLVFVLCVMCILAGWNLAAVRHLESVLCTHRPVHGRSFVANLAGNISVWLSHRTGVQFPFEPRADRSFSVPIALPGGGCHVRAVSCCNCPISTLAADVWIILILVWGEFLNLGGMFVVRNLFMTGVRSHPVSFDSKIAVCAAVLVLPQFVRLVFADVTLVSAVTSSVWQRVAQPSEEQKGDQNRRGSPILVRSPTYGSIAFPLLLSGNLKPVLWIIVCSPFLGFAGRYIVACTLLLRLPAALIQSALSRRRTEEKRALA